MLLSYWIHLTYVTPHSENKPKISFSEKPASATDVTINGPYLDPGSILQNRRWDQKLPKISAQENWLSVVKRKDIRSVDHTMVRSP